MAMVTPRRSGRGLPPTPRMSERKRALFQPPSGSMPSSDSDCDLGILSPIDTDSGSDIDQSVPITPNSWRGSGQSKEGKKYTTKNVRLNQTFSPPKARRSLFNANMKQGLSPKSFYPKTNANLDTSFTSEASKLTTIPHHPKQAKNARSTSRHSYKKNRRKRLGEINCGVSHGIRKPKPSKSSSVKNLDAIMMALNIIGNSPLNDYFKEYYMSQKSSNSAAIDHLEDKTSQTTPKDQLTTAKDRQMTPKELVKAKNLQADAKNLRMARNARETSPINDYIKDFMNFKNNKVAINYSDKNIPDTNQKEKTHDKENCLPQTNDLFEEEEDEENFAIPELNSIQALLTQWTEEDVPSTEKRIVKSVVTTPAISDSFASGTESIVEMSAVLPETFESTSMQDGLPEHVAENHETLLIANTPNGTPHRAVGSFSSPVVSDADNSWDSMETCVSDQRTAGEKRKMFPIFDKDSAKKMKLQEDSVVTSLPAAKRLCKDDRQYIIDAGQKSLGLTQCNDCGVIYQKGDARDENDHMTHHMALDILRFHGWKHERVCGCWGTGRILVVQAGDSASHWQRITELLDRVVHPQLGYAAPLALNKTYKVYLYIEGKQLVGCLVAEQLQEAYKMLPIADMDCVSTEAYPVKCGISRIWTHVSYRKKNVATSLVDAMRANFFFGHILSKNEIAFSSPTPMGKAFAEKYTKTQTFYVYID